MAVLAELDFNLTLLNFQPVCYRQKNLPITTMQMMKDRMRMGMYSGGAPSRIMSDIEGVSSSAGLISCYFVIEKLKWSSHNAYNAYESY